jgi:hypothetical protein
MSSLPLISHHLFVAAVNEKSWASGIQGRPEVLVPAPEVRLRELPIEWIEFGRPLPLETSVPFDVPHRIGST